MKQSNLNLYEEKETYNSFLISPCGKQWDKVGIQRRSGISTPLFSIYSKNSTGIGEIPDLKLLIEWCILTNMSIIQILPMNDTGFRFTPYDAESSFALEPMYLSLNELNNIDTKKFQNSIKNIKKNFPLSGGKVNYDIKKAKLDLLWEIFKKINLKDEIKFDDFIAKNNFWLKDYVLFKVIKEKNNQKSWLTWEKGLKERNKEELEKFEKHNLDRVQFHAWLQWQLFEQLKIIKEYANKKNILVMGDIPILTSMDSADVWANRNYFKLELSSGAPPDLYNSKGQRWGMPPYNWEAISKDNYEYLIQKIKYAENFYHLFRIDHSVGLFRIWTISTNEPLENQGLNGTFDPKDENLWEEHGKKLLTIIIQNTDMLPCAEDLGTIPECSYKVLSELAIPGTDVQRWTKRVEYFKLPEEYRKNSVSTISTHDMNPLNSWWLYEAGTIDEGLFQAICKKKKINFTKAKEELFDLENSFYGRLRWKKAIDSVDKLLAVLNLKKEAVLDLIDFYKTSYNEKNVFWNYLQIKEEIKEDHVTYEFVKKSLEQVNKTSSIFSVQLLQDWLSLSELPMFSSYDFRINIPGTVNDKNWTLIMPFSLEEMLTLSINETIKEINTKSKRV